LEEVDILFETMALDANAIAWTWTATANQSKCAIIGKTT
jgi:hypothetical protein